MLAVLGDTLVQEGNIELVKFDYIILKNAAAIAAIAAITSGIADLQISKSPIGLTKKIWRGSIIG